MLQSLKKKKIFSLGLLITFPRKINNNKYLKKITTLGTKGMGKSLKNVSKYGI